MSCVNAMEGVVLSAALYRTLPPLTRLARLAIAKGTSTLIGRCWTFKNILEMATLFISRVFLFHFRNCILHEASMVSRPWQGAVVETQTREYLKSTALFSVRL